MSPHRARSLWLLGMLLAGGLLGSGCSTAPSTRLYILTSLAPSAAAPTATPPGLAIGVGPVQLPQYTNRPGMVTADHGQELHSADFAQWAEPLRDNFVRVLAENLSLLLATERVALFPWKNPLPLDYQIIVEVIHFLGTTGGEVTLVALWSVIGKDGKAVLVSRKTSVREVTSSPDYDALAAAMSRAVAALSHDIASTIRTLP
jgi:uncharacterized protein